MGSMRLRRGVTMLLLLLLSPVLGDESIKFVVLSTQRSGSTYLMSLLRSVQRATPKMRTVISEPVGQELREGGITPRTMSTLGFQDFEPFLRRAFARFGCELSASGEPRSTTCGAKIMYNQLPNAAFGPSETSRAIMRWFLERNLRFVHLIRRSHVRKVLSNLKLQATGLAHNRGVSTASSSYALSIDPIKVLRGVELSAKASVAHRLELRRAIPNKFLLELYYEDLLKDNLTGSTATISNLLAFLSPAGTDLRAFTQYASSDILRNTRDSCANLLVSWPAVQQGLQTHIFNLQRSQQTIAQRGGDTDPLIDYQISDIQFSILDCSVTEQELTSVHGASSAPN